MDTTMLTILAAQTWARSLGLELTYEKPDELNRRDRAVDLLGRDLFGCPRLVLEHTLVESFLDQRTSQVAAVKMFEPLERELSGRLPGPGHYTLAVAPRGVFGLKSESRRVRKWVAQWIRDTAPTLPIGGPGSAPDHFAPVAVPDSALEVTLGRWPGRDRQFGLVFNAPNPGDDVLTPSLRRAIDSKCPKLAQARASNPPAVSLLLLEIRDIALGNLFDLDAVVQAWLTTSPLDVPDQIWLVDTIDEPPSIVIAAGDGKGKFLPFFLGSEESRPSNPSSRPK